MLLKKSIFPLFLVSFLFIFLNSFFYSNANAAARQQGSTLSAEEWLTLSAAIGQDSPAYQILQQSGALSAENAGQGLSMLFSPSGVAVGTGAQAVALRPVLWGYGDELSRLSGGTPQAVGNMVAISHGSVSEWYVNGPLGLQQGFTVAEKPQAGSGPLKISMALKGAKAGSVDEDGKGVMLTNSDGSPLYRYSGLVVRDADGRQADAWLEPGGDMLSICVADAGHRYPMYIDPIIQAAKLTSSEEDTAGFGVSVAVSGDTVVVGVSHMNYGKGAAFIYI